MATTSTTSSALSVIRKINFVRTRLQCVKKLLRVEEALFRHSKENWVIINDGAKEETIVLGISGKPEELVHECEAKQLSVPLVKRFTGGGTVVVDHNTQFVSFIFNEGTIDGLELFPRKIMEWTGAFYGKVMEGMFSSSSNSSSSALREKNASFSLRENDYVFGEKKFGGNAQSISKSRFIHHTSFLYDYDKALMDLLKSPKKQPEYRANRSHDDFVATLKSKYAKGEEGEVENRGKGRELLLDAVYANLREHHDFEVRSISFDAAENILLDYNENVKQSSVKLWCDRERKWNICED